MFNITNSKGFSITFENGWTVSVQFGAFNYCDNYRIDKGNEEKYIGMTIEQQNFFAGESGSKLAETALIDEDGDFFEYAGDNVQGYRTPAQVLELLNYASELKPIKPKEIKKCNGQ